MHDSLARDRKVTSIRAGTTVLLRIECGDSYAAIKLHDGICEAAAKGSVTLRIEGDVPDPEPGRS